jgi:hypothetical protein
LNSGWSAETGTWDGKQSQHMKRIIVAQNNNSRPMPLEIPRWLG